MILKGILMVFEECCRVFEKKMRYEISQTPTHTVYEKKSQKIDEQWLP